MRGAALLAALATLAGCASLDDPLAPVSPASIAAPTLRPFADGKFWVVERDVVFRSGGEEIRVPAGFVTDLASVPRFARSFRSPVGTYTRAAIVHDWLYWTGVCLPEEADRIFYRAMISSGSTTAIARQMYGAVRGFGKTAFEANAKERHAGWPHAVPLDRLALLDDHGWVDVRTMLGHGPPPGEPVRAKFCAIGQVPLPKR